MKALLKAVRAALRTDVTIAGLVPGGIFAGFAQSGTAMPYLLWNHVGSIRPDYNTGQPQIERHLLRFRTFAISAVAAAECSEAIEKLLVGTLPPLDKGTTMQILKDTDLIDLDPDLSEQGEEVWVSTLQLEAMVHRNPFV